MQQNTLRPTDAILSNGSSSNTLRDYKKAYPLTYPETSEEDKHANTCNTKHMSTPTHTSPKTHNMCLNPSIGHTDHTTTDTLHTPFPTSYGKTLESAINPPHSQQDAAHTPLPLTPIPTPLSSLRSTLRPTYKPSTFQPTYYNHPYCLPRLKRMTNITLI